MDRRRKTHIPDAVYQDKQLVIVRVLRPSGLRFVGAIDASNADPVAEAMAGALNGQSETELHLDLSGLEFNDVSGIRALASAAEKTDGRHRLILYGLPPQMRKVMLVVGWFNLPTLLIAETGFPDGEQTDGADLERA